MPSMGGAIYVSKKETGHARCTASGDGYDHSSK